MKKLVITLLSLMACVSSCSLLKEDPQIQIPTENFYKTQEDALAGLNGAYASMKFTVGYYRQTFITNIYASSDQGTGSFKHLEFETGLLSSTNSVLTDSWNGMYIAIKDANNVIYNVPNIEMNEVLRNRIVGEARFLRGLHYFNLVRTFGEVPLRTVPAKSGEDEVGLPISTLDKIYNVIISDFKYASEHCWGLEETREGYTNAIGRVTKGAAEGMLAKVYLHMASSTRNALLGNKGLEIYEVFGSNYIAYYDSAQVFATKCIENSDYTLVSNASDFQLIFHVTNGNNREILFDVQNAPISGHGSAITNLFTPQGAGLSAGNWGGTNEVRSAFVLNNINAEDKRYLLSVIPEYQTSAHRFVLNPKNAGYLRFNLETGEQEGQVYQVYTSKYIDKEATSDATAQQNWHVLRLADVYLIRAEAVAELYKNPSLAENDINILRERVGMEDFFLGNGMSLNDFRDFLIRERGVELLAEGQRFFDLTRLGLLEKCVKSAFDPNNTGKIEGIRGPENYQWPIPESERAANENIN